MEPERTSGQSSGEQQQQRGGWSAQKAKQSPQPDFGQAGKRHKIAIAHQHVFLGMYSNCIVVGVDDRGRAIVVPHAIFVVLFFGRVSYDGNNQRAINIIIQNSISR